MTFVAVLKIVLQETRIMEKGVQKGLQESGPRDRTPGNQDYGERGSEGAPGNQVSEDRALEKGSRKPWVLETGL